MFRRFQGLCLMMGAALACGCSESDDDDAQSVVQDALPADGPEQMSFFVTSETSETANLGGLAGADATCQRLAEAAGNTRYTFQAYLGAENGGDPIHPGARIGNGPWRNYDGVVISSNVGILHTRPGDADVFLDENGNMINGQWADSPAPVEHDVLTGATPEGMVAMGFTCEDWTSDSADIAPRVGHSDGLGPMQDGSPPRNSWNSAHEAESCANMRARGGAGRFYCFATDDMGE